MRATQACGHAVAANRAKAQAECVRSFRQSDRTQPTTAVAGTSQPTCTQHQDTHSSDTPSCRHPCGFPDGHQQPAALAAEHRCGTGLMPTAGTRMVVKLVGMLQKPNRQGAGKQCSVCGVRVCSTTGLDPIVGQLHRRLQQQSGTYHTNGTTTRGVCQPADHLQSMGNKGGQTRCRTLQHQKHVPHREVKRAPLHAMGPPAMRQQSMASPIRPCCE